ncbi:MAG: hypothetical protein J0L93_03350 [Deltaproteobacteria bacterium]|nr:hypothetical protein [Deltaproteobacteria bacterium]
MRFFSRKSKIVFTRLSRFEPNMDEKEYLERRTVSEFLDWVDATNLNRQKTGKSNAYRSREGLWKKYADEAEPLGRFLRGNSNIPRTAAVSMGIESSKPDALLEWPDKKIPVEITTTDDLPAIHNRRQLNDHGFGPGETNNVQTGKDLAVQKAAGNPRDFGQVMSGDYMEKTELKRISDRLRNKLSKKYNSETILIVDSCSTSLFDVEEDRVRNHLQEFSSQKIFREIWIQIFSGRVLKL